MTWAHTRRSEKDYRAAPAAIRKAFDKQVRLLAMSLSHPSLHAKKYDEGGGPLAGPGEPRLVLLFSDPGRGLRHRDHHSAPEMIQPRFWGPPSPARGTNLEIRLT